MLLQRTSVGNYSEFFVLCETWEDSVTDQYPTREATRCIYTIKWESRPYNIPHGPSSSLCFKHIPVRLLRTSKEPSFHSLWEETAISHGGYLAQLSKVWTQHKSHSTEDKLSALCRDMNFVLCYFFPPHSKHHCMHTAQLQQATHFEPRGEQNSMLLSG